MADLSVDSNLSGTVNSVISGSVGSIGPVTLSGLPDHYTISIDKLPTVRLKVDPLESTINLKPVSLHIDPIETRIAITEIPSVRTHLPASYSIGLSLFGVEVASVQLCGEGQVITEPYRPNPCEVCGGRQSAAELAALGTDALRTAASEA